MALYTPETARAASIKANQIRWHKYRNPTPVPVQNGTQSGIPEGIPDDYREMTLARVRAQLTLLLDALDGAIAGKIQQLDRKGNVTIIDPQGIDRISSSIWRVSEMERKYAGRPDPGSFRPQADKSSRRQGRPVEVWVDETPQPIAETSQKQVDGT